MTLGEKVRLPLASPTFTVCTAAEATERREARMEKVDECMLKEV
jgi:hypothetical protein